MGVGAGDQVVEVVGWLGFGEAVGDGVVGVDCCEGGGDGLEAVFGGLGGGVGHGADEFVAAVADEQVVGADVGAECLAGAA